MEQGPNRDALAACGGARRRRLLLLLLALLPLAADATCYACRHRNAEAKHEFVSAHPCPSTGRTRGSCPGWIVDHAWPICAGGPDAPSNMRWEEEVESLDKDDEERRLCEMDVGEVATTTGRAGICRVIHGEGDMPLLEQAVCR